MTTYEDFQALIDRYPKEFKRCNVTASTLLTLQRFTIIETCTTPTETETKEVTAYNYALIVSSIGVFHDRLTFAYTFGGKIPTKFTSKSPNGEKYVREFKIIKNY